MSDMYLELKARIPVVAEKTHLGRQRIEDAQDAVGLSNEQIARRIPVSEKTWRRWKKAGAIPTASLPAAARALRLELHTLNPEAAEQEETDQRLLAAQIAEALPLLREIAARLREDDPASTQADSSAA